MNMVEFFRQLNLEFARVKMKSQVVDEEIFAALSLPIKISKLSMLEIKFSGLVDDRFKLIHLGSIKCRR